MVLKQIATLVKCLKIKMSRVVNSQMICKMKIHKFVIDFYTCKLQPYWVTGQYWVS